MRFGPVPFAAAALLGVLLTACASSPPPVQEPSSSPPPVQEPSTPPSASSPPPGAGGTPSADATPDPGPGSAAAGGPAAQAKLCGGIAGVQCPAHEYCAFGPEAHCGAGDMSGTCAKVPDACIQLVDEVCGCDDKTYGNACMAAQAGVSVVAKGSCPTHDAATTKDGGLCGTRGAAGACEPASYCAYKPDCGTTDAGGVCTKKPTICTKIYKPVCGCNGRTYGNACAAAAEGMSVVHDGACTK
jgi:hypothetical protein